MSRGAQSRRKTPRDCLATPRDPIVISTVDWFDQMTHAQIQRVSGYVGRMVQRARQRQQEQAENGPDDLEIRGTMT